MAEPTAVNSQITDAITQSNLTVLAQSPAFALAAMYQTQAHAIGLMFHNAVAAQQQQNILGLAVVQRSVMLIGDISGRHAAPAWAPAQAGLDSVATPVAAAPADPSIAIGRFAEALGEARDQTDDASHGKRLQVLKLAAMAACVEGALRSPEHAQVYGELLDTIKDLA